MDKKIDRGRVGKEPQKKEDIDFIDMWGDKIVGKPMNIYPQPPEHIVTDKVSRLWGSYWLRRDGTVYYSNGSVQKEVPIAGYGDTRHFFHGKRKVVFNLRNELAKAFLPNPAGLPYVRIGRLENDKVYTADNLTWSSYRTYAELRDRAHSIEMARGRYPEIFNPAIEVPVTITLFSRV